jgi:hypothetical protein
MSTGMGYWNFPKSCREIPVSIILLNILVLSDVFLRSLKSHAKIFHSCYIFLSSLLVVARVIS